jgi:hypothetical protein
MTGSGSSNENVFLVLFHYKITGIRHSGYCSDSDKKLEEFEDDMYQFKLVRSNELVNNDSAQEFSQSSTREFSQSSVNKTWLLAIYNFRTYGCNNSDYCNYAPGYIFDEQCYKDYIVDYTIVITEDILNSVSKSNKYVETVKNILKSYQDGLVIPTTSELDSSNTYLKRCSNELYPQDYNIFFYYILSRN